jgi:hypothetical protein
VVDTTAPTLGGMPGDADLTTSGSSATLTYASPTASDVVDPAPAVGCLPASGSSLPVGDTTVTCTATDASGNSSSASFTAHVAFVAPPPSGPPPSDPPSGPPPSDPPSPPPSNPPPSNPPANPPAPPAGSWNAYWEQPVRGGTLVVRGARTVPVKVRLVHDGKQVKKGLTVLTISQCGGGDVERTLRLRYQSNGRWMGNLRLAGLRPGCHQAVVSVNGQVFGSFTLDVRGHGGSCYGKGLLRL